MLDALLRTALPGSAAALAWLAADASPLGRRLSAVWHYRVLKLSLALFFLPVWLIADWAASLAPRPVTASPAGTPIVPHPAPAAAPPVEQTAAVPVPVNGLALLTAVWAAGALAVLCCRLWAYVRFRRDVLAHNRPVTSPETLAVFESCKRQTGIRQAVALTENPAVRVPLSTGLLRPAVVLPTGAMEPSELRYALLHELTHLRRHDLWVRLLAMLAGAIHWYDPLVYVMKTGILRYSEQSCDELVAGPLSGNQRFAYGSMLLRLSAEDGVCPREWAAPLSARDTVERRLYAVLHPEKMKGKKRLLALVLAVLILACGSAAALAAQGPIVGAAAPAASSEGGQPPVSVLPSAAASALDALRESIAYGEGGFRFNIPEGEGEWSIHIAGRAADGGGMSVHYLEDEAWVPGQSYAFEAPLDYTELAMDAEVDGESASIDLLAYLGNGAVSLSWPVQGNNFSVSSGFGSRTRPDGLGEITHDGIDIPAPIGEVVLAAADGAVSETGYDASRGNYLILDHGNGLATLYAHCRNVSVETGGTVERGGMIGAVGSTGMSTGSHLHFEVRLDGEAQDPMEWLAWDLPETQGVRN